MSIINIQNILDYTIIRNLFTYDYKRGFLIWKVSTDKNVPGEKVGYINSNGYRVVTINAKTYYVHRLIWLWCNGYYPENFIDHINRKRHDNRISNLREVSQSCNMRNSSIPITNKSGIKGVFWRNINKVWQVQINVNGKQKHIGYFPEFTEAVFHRFAAEQCAWWEICDSKSPAALYVKSQIGV